jgi:FMN phosphatase YigB (HAD superfamily)
MRPWPEAPRVLAAIAAAMPIGTVTNCSDELGHQAADLVSVPFEVTVTAQSAGSYKPQPEPYRQALEALALPAERSCSWPDRHTASPAPGRSAWMWRAAWPRLGGDTCFRDGLNAQL